jgi:hypothetical protein
MIVRASVTGTIVGADDPQQVPRSFALYQNYPNPFNPRTKVRFDLPHRARTRLTLYNILGQAVRSVLDKELEAGIHYATVDATSLPSGVYFYRIEADEFVDTRKMIVLK